MISISVFIDMLNAFQFKYCSFLIESLISTFYDKRRCVNTEQVRFIVENIENARE